MSEIEFCLEPSVTLVFSENQRERSSSPKQEEAWEEAANRLFSLCLSSPLLSRSDCRMSPVQRPGFWGHLCKPSMMKLSRQLACGAAGESVE